MNDSMQTNDSLESIDAVITWVDGNDPAHKNKMQRYLKGTAQRQNDSFLTRYRQVNEIEFTVHSILKFAPFIRRIFIVTDAQRPAFLQKKMAAYSKVKVIDHQILFKKNLSVLPVFNSRSIETKLYAIPGLSERFIYFNDDILLLKPVSVRDFFREDKVVLRGRWTSFREGKLHKQLFPRKAGTTSFTQGQENSAKKVGFNRLFRYDHCPQPLHRSTLESYFLENPTVETQNCQYRFRNGNQFLSVGLAHHLEIKNNRSIIEHNMRLAFFSSYKKPLCWLQRQFYRLENNNNKWFLNLQSLDLCPAKKQAFIMDWLERYYQLDF